jgi:DNA-binding response OmpR family regulator/anti-sigma regulatory factor (Ser/Thr protein kinase)
VAFDLPPDLPRVMADRRRIVQVLNNLLANAAQQAPESSAIRVSAAREDAHVAVSVSDEGPGLAPERLAQLFRKHVASAAGAPEGRSRGHGLGLAICKGLVEAHGGRIRAESAGAGRGTTVVFTLPVTYETAGEATGVSPAPPGESRADDAPPRILVVDDDPQTLRLVRGALAAEGYAPVVTGDHEDLAHLLRAEPPALVVLDLMLPGVDGIELMRQIPELADLPVIFISGYGRDETIARALDAGAADYIVKPFSPSELTARVRAALRRQTEPKPFRLGDLSIRYAERQVTVDGEPVALTVTEFEVLRLLSSHAGRVVTYESLLRQAWRGRARSTEDPKVVRAMVKSLRRKLGDDAAQPAYVLNERGVGYRMPGPGEI